MSNPLDSLSSTGSGLAISSESAAHLRETGGWARFLSIIGFIVIGLILLAAFFVGSMMSAMGMGGNFAGMEVMLGIIYFAGAALYFFPILFLFRFATNVIDAVKMNDGEALAVALKNLKSHYKFIGILTAIVVGIYACIFLVAIVVGSMF